MIYVIGNKIKAEMAGFWNEGTPYSRRNIYSKQANTLPPVNYDEHTLKPHSLTHAESPLHTNNDGKPLHSYIEKSPHFFFGEALVLKFPNNYVGIDGTENTYIKIITRNEIESKINEVCNGKAIPPKILLTTENYPENENAFHAENYILVLDVEAAEYLISIPGFHLFGTTWKSTDYQPKSPTRPIHDTIFKKAVIFELLNLSEVPEGIYYFSGMPLFIENSNESPVTPILIDKSYFETS